MADQGRAPAGRPMTLVWMVLALVVVGGFLTWLSIASEPTTVVVVEDYDEDERNGDVVGGLAVVERDTLAVAIEQYVDQQVRVRAVPATGRLGPTIFWGELGDMARQRPVLVRMDGPLPGGAEVQTGVEYTITGQVLQVTEELVNTWAEAGEFAGEGEQMQAAFADYYIQASAVRPTRGAGGQQGR
jgi:hypothetical protein